MTAKTKSVADEPAATLAGGASLKSTLKKMRLQYLGFSVVTGGREYNFRMAGEDNADRSFIVIVGNAAFLPGRLKYQEGPDITYRKLLSALAVEPGNPPMCLRQQVTESEVTDYTAAASPKARKWTEEQRTTAGERFRKRLQGLG